MKATVNGITYEGTEDEIRRIVSNPPAGPAPEITRSLPPGYGTSTAANTVKCTHCGNRVDADEAHYVRVVRGSKYTAYGRNAVLCHDCYKRALDEPWLT